ncbi:DUF6302 family protein [Streptomyces scopuliridis]|uniref:DUF6302 family protein n=1 Tax=Streptomyces scopuliridis TaxID=452529 RepID=UPI0036CD10C5
MEKGSRKRGEAQRGTHAGYLTVADYAEALATIAVLDGQPGFPHVRLGRTVTSRDSRRTITWGEDPSNTDAVARWQFYGYSDASIGRYAQTPEGEPGDPLPASGR